MRTALEVELTFEQVLAIVKQLPQQEKILLTKELESEGVETKLSKLLKAFETTELSLTVIDEEVEIVRKRMYDNQKLEGHI